MVHAKRGVGHQKQDGTHAFEVLLKVPIIGIVWEQWQALGSVGGDGDQRVAELENVLPSVRGCPVAHVVDPVCGGVVVKTKDGAVLFNIEQLNAILLLELASSEECEGASIRACKESCVDLKFEHIRSVSSCTVKDVGWSMHTG